jgi:hypothetical protein
MNPKTRAHDDDELQSEMKTRQASNRSQHRVGRVQSNINKMIMLITLVLPCATSQLALTLLNFKGCRQSRVTATQQCQQLTQQGRFDGAELWLGDVQHT